MTYAELQAKIEEFSPMDQWRIKYSVKTPKGHPRDLLVYYDALSMFGGKTEDFDISLECDNHLRLGANMNDTFWYACSWFPTIPPKDFLEVWVAGRIFGSYGITAHIARVHKLEPIKPVAENEKYKAAVAGYDEVFTVIEEMLANPESKMYWPEPAIEFAGWSDE